MDAKSERHSAHTASANVFRKGSINGWPLFWLIVLPMNAFLLMEMRAYDLGTPEGVSEMIGYSVRWAVPFIYLVLAASAMPVLFPSEFSRWWLRNRRYIGLVFAVAMAWQGAFIFIMSNLHSGYYYDEVYYLRDELEGSSGYIFLAAMVLTSFRFGRKRLSSAQWKVLHRSGVYFLWAYPFSVYWWNVHYYKTAEAIDYIFYWTGFLAFAVRIAAWGKKRARQQPRSGTSTSFISKATGSAMIALGLIASATGGYWQAPVSAVLLAPKWSATLELWLPFWPFEPYLSLIVIGIGTWLSTGALQTPALLTGTGTGARA